MLRLRNMLCALVMASGCTSVRPIDEASLRRGVIPALAPNEGILVVCVDTEVPLAEIQVSG